MTGNDKLALALITAGVLIVDVDLGEVWRSGQRAERAQSTGYGVVDVARRKAAMAHRVVWLAAHGDIPGRLTINHKNRRRWDNRIENLELVMPTAQLLHRNGRPYDSVGSGGVSVSRMRELIDGETPERTPGRPDVYRQSRPFV